MGKQNPPKPTKAALNTWKGLTTTPKGAASLKKKIADQRKADAKVVPPSVRGALPSVKPPKVKLKPGADAITGYPKKVRPWRGQMGKPQAGRKI